jgi:GNAT superfamily N-acetyltransferase
MSILVAAASPTDAPALSVLVRASFMAFVAPDWEPAAQQVFLAEASPERLSTVLSDPSFAATAHINGELVGFILLPRPTRLSMLFVHPAMVRQGVGKALWEAARAHIEANYPESRTIELNASPYAVPAYAALGFYPISAPFRLEGCLVTRMACWLPGRALSG